MYHHDVKRKTSLDVINYAHTTRERGPPLRENMPSAAAEKNRKRRARKREETKRVVVKKPRGVGVSDVLKDKGPGDAPIEFVRRTGAYGSYGANNNTASGRFSIEDDEWATSQRAWNALATHLARFKRKKIWSPFFYDGRVKGRLQKAGFIGKITHEKKDFFKAINDSKFIANVDVIIDNPPYTGKGMKEKILTLLVTKDIPFCLLLPLGVLHAKFLRDLTKNRREKVQAIIPRRVFVHKENEEELPFKYLVWLCYGLELERDLVLMDED